MNAGIPPADAPRGGLPRALPVAIAVVLVAALVLAIGSGGEARTLRLAALEAHQVLGGVAEEGDPPSLAEMVLDGPDAARESPETVLLRLSAVRFLSDGVEQNAELTASARRALIRGLRSAGDAGPRGSGGTPVSVLVEGEKEPVEVGSAFDVERTPDGLTLNCRASDGTWRGASIPWSPPSRASLIPPLVAIVLAIATRRPLLALALGVLSGAWLVSWAGGSGRVEGLLQGTARAFDTYLWDQLEDLSNIQIITFVVLMLAMVGNLTRNGGIRGVMDRLRNLAKGTRSTQTSTVGMGFAIFFDDYANTVLVGSTMRPLTDRLRISREKLAYLVDSTAAPVAGLSIFSTWIAFEVSTFAPQLPVAGLLSTDGYQVFLQTLPYRFYCILTLVMVILVAASGRDFGPMRRAEARARTTGQLVRPGGQALVGTRATSLDMAEGVQPRAWRAVLPLLAFIGVTLFEIARRGGAFAMALSELFTLGGVTAVLYDGSGNAPLMIGSMAGFGLAALASLQAGLSPLEVARAAWTTLSSMGIALGILYLAWMVGAVCEDLGTASFLSVAIGGALDPVLLPAVLVLLAAFVAFSTGSSWGTMSILLPLVVGLSFELGEQLPIGPTMLMVLSIGAVLEGAIFGDHCSPISDTTVLSSISSASDHIDHVRTQAPYALVVMSISLGVGYLPAAALGWSPLVCWGLALALLVAVLLILGRKAPEAPAP